MTPGPRPLAQRLRSCATTAFSNARRRQPVRWVRAAFAHFTGLLRASAPNLRWHDLEVGLIDGSTFRLRPHGNIPKRFAPACNQHGPAYWCLVRVVVVFCASSGLALATGLGPVTVSEQTLAVALVLRGTAVTTSATPACSGCRWTDAGWASRFSGRGFARTPSTCSPR